MAQLSLDFRGPKLFQDYLRDFERVEMFYGSPWNIEAIVERIKRVSDRHFARRQLADVLTNDAFHAHRGSAARAAVEALGEEDVFAVVTGQQPGLWSGPLYTIYKAVHCVLLAQELSQRSHRRVVPVFWVASEDHDLAEINHIHWGSGSRTDKVVVPLGPEGCAAETARFDPAKSDWAQVLRGDESPGAYAEEVLARCQQYFRWPAGEAFVRWMMHLFQDTPLVFVQPSALRPLMRAVIARELVSARKNAERVYERGLELEAHGYAVPIATRFTADPRDPSSTQIDTNLYYIDETLLRRRLRVAPNGRFALRGSTKQLGLADLQRTAELHPHHFSTNVALRPVVQESVIPTAAMVAGPSEIAYFAQLKPLFSAHGLEMPPLVPRKSATLIDKAVQRRLRRSGIRVEDLLGASLEVDRTSTDPNLLEVESVAQHILGSCDRLETLLATLDPGHLHWHNRRLSRIQSQVSLLRNRAESAVRERQDRETEDRLWVVARLLPSGSLQERRLNIVQFLFNYGFGLIPYLLNALNFRSTDHQIIDLSDLTKIN